MREKLLDCSSRPLSVRSRRPFATVSAKAVAVASSMSVSKTSVTNSVALVSAEVGRVHRDGQVYLSEKRRCSVKPLSLSLYDAVSSFIYVCVSIGKAVIIPEEVFALVIGLEGALE